MPEQALDLVIRGRDQASQVFERFGKGVGNQMQSMLLRVAGPIAGVTAAFRLAGQGAELWGATSELAAAKASGSLVKTLEAQIKVNTAWAELASAIPMVGASITKVLEAFSGSAALKERIADLKEITAWMAASSKAIDADTVALRKRREELRDAPKSERMVGDMVERQAARWNDLKKAREAELKAEKDLEKVKTPGAEALAEQMRAKVASGLLASFVQRDMERQIADYEKQVKAAEETYNQVVNRRRFLETRMREEQVLSAQEIGKTAREETEKTHALEMQDMAERRKFGLEIEAELAAARRPAGPSAAALQALLGMVEPAQEIPTGRVDTSMLAGKALMQRLKEEARARREARPVPNAEEITPRERTVGDVAEAARKLLEANRKDSAEVQALLKSLPAEIAAKLGTVGVN